MSSVINKNGDKMNKSYSLYPFGKWLPMVLFSFVAVFILFGFVIDKEGFPGNFLAGLAGNLIAILVGLLLIDRYLEYRRKQKWAKVRNLTLGAIAAHLCDIASNLYIYFPIRNDGSMATILKGRNWPNHTTPAGFENLLEELRSLPNSVSKEKSTSDIAVEFYKEVTWDLDQIQSVLTPRVIQSSGDQTLIDALVEFDDARRNLDNSIIAHKLVITHGVFQNVILLVQSAGHLYQALCKSWEKTRHPRVNSYKFRSRPLLLNCLKCAFNDRHWEQVKTLIKQGKSLPLLPFLHRKK